MSDASAFGFGKFVPGFDFLQNLGQAANPGAKGSPQCLPVPHNITYPAIKSLIKITDPEMAEK